jgi:hypothetical protein
MAIDLMIMPLSRYWSGDYVTPLMSSCWEQGIPYKIATAQGIREFPPGTPFGGADAAKQRKQFITVATEYIRRLPFGIGKSPWDERSATPPAFIRVDPTSYGALLAECETRFSFKPSFFARLGGKRTKHSHVAACAVLLPSEFDAVFELDGKRIGSLFRAKDELAGADWPESVNPSLSLVREAIRKAIELHFPMIVDM